MGSPPRMRGKPVFGQTFFCPFGITPAHAGKTPAHRDSSCHNRDHPRACGENSLSEASGLFDQGSPPRMRGKPSQRDTALLLDGITPAHAGKTPAGALRMRRRRDHPRACGENSTPSIAAMRSAGSPPRMRGKPGGDVIGIPARGITPAHAGKTTISSRQRRASRDHPRACGENSSPTPDTTRTPGSPPRMRGKRNQ